MLQSTMATTVQNMPSDPTLSSIDVSDTLHTTYQDYPPTQPFIHDTYRRQDKPITAYPESNRQAVMSALKGLQDKIRQLEIERTTAESNLKDLSDETTQYRDMLDSPRRSTAKFNTGMQGELDNTESRCQLLEKQLDYMRHMVKTAETDRTDTLKRVSDIEKQRGSASTKELQNQIDKIAELERDHLRLTATQTIAQGKIKELEDKLKEEQHYRRMMQQQNSELLSQATKERVSPLKGKSSRMKKKKKKSPQHSKRYRSPSRGRDHYRLNLADLPFVAGKSTEPSHSLPANLQQMLSLMKNHNVWLCNSPSKCHQRALATRGRSHYRSDSSISSAESSSYSSNGDLDELLLQLQDEFGHMSFEHQELSRQIQESIDLRLKDDLERELDSLVAQMEAKGDQIAQLRRHREKSEDKKVKRKIKHMNEDNTSRSHRASIPVTGSRSGEVQVTTTIKTKGPVHYRSHSAGPGNSGASLDLYKNLKKIQSSLRRDDLIWEA